MQVSDHTTDLPHLDLQDVVTANALVVHIMVGFIRVATVLILNEREPTHSQVSTEKQGESEEEDILQSAARRTRGGNIAANQSAIAIPGMSASLETHKHWAKRRLFASAHDQARNRLPRLAGDSPGVTRKRVIADRSIDRRGTRARSGEPRADHGCAEVGRRATRREGT